MHPLDTLTAPALLVLIVITIGYVLSCAVYPYKPCRSCQGIGHFRAPFLRAIRLCRRCGGTGRILRAGRCAYNAATRTRRAYRQARDHRDHNR